MLEGLTLIIQFTCSGLFMLWRKLAEFSLVSLGGVIEFVLVKVLRIHHCNVGHYVWVQEWSAVSLLGRPSSHHDDDSAEL